MQIKVMGSGCPNCEKLFDLVSDVINEQGLEATVEKVTDMNEITKAGVLMTPGLVVDGEVKTSGKIPSKEELTQLLS